MSDRSLFSIDVNNQPEVLVDVLVPEITTTNPIKKKKKKNDDIYFLWPLTVVVSLWLYSLPYTTLIKVVL